MTGNRKKAAGLDALKNLSATQGHALTDMLVSKPETEQGETKKAGKVVFSLHLPKSAHSKLRELSFHERNSMTQLILEGVDLLFAQRGVPSMMELHKDIIK